MHETRFRDILTVESNLKILSELINKDIGEIHKFRLISKELPLPRDVIGLQNRYCDFVLVDENFSIYIIELKKSIKSIKSLKALENQLLEYKDLMDKTLNYVNGNNRLFYQHKIFLRYFQYAGVSPDKIGDIVPLILSIYPIEKSLQNKTEIRCLSFRKISTLVKNYEKTRIERFKSVNRSLDDKTEERVNSLIDKQIRRGFLPLIIQYETLKTGKTHLKIVFENLNHHKKEYVDLGEIDECNSKLKLPTVFHYELDPENVFERILNKLRSSGENSKFSIQIFRSGLTNPIIYLETGNGLFMPLIQTKPVTFIIGSELVDDRVAFDAKERFDDDKKLFYHDVILFDDGIYTMKKVEEFGVSFYILELRGKDHVYEFKLYSPKFRNVQELLPYMTPQKVRKVLNDIKSAKGSEYLFKSENDPQIEWIGRVNIKYPVFTISQ